MRIELCLSLLFLTALSAIAGDVRTINASCENAIVKAELLAAQRKWWPERPDPKAPVLNVRTHANFAKQVLLPLGLVSHLTRAKARAWACPSPEPLSRHIADRSPSSASGSGSVFSFTMPIASPHAIE